MPRIEPPTEDFFRQLLGPDGHALRQAHALADDLQLLVNRLSANPGALVQLSAAIKPEAGSLAEAVAQVRAQIATMADDSRAFAEAWAVIRKNLAQENRFLRLAALDHDEALGAELRRLADDFQARKAKAISKRGVLIDAGIGHEEAERLAPEPVDESTQRGNAIRAQREICSEYLRTLDGSRLPAAVYDRARQIEAMNGVSINKFQALAS